MELLVEEDKSVVEVSWPVVIVGVSAVGDEYPGEGVGSSPVEEDEDEDALVTVLVSDEALSAVERSECVTGVESDEV